MTSISEKYDLISVDYDEKYVEGDNNPYMHDERLAARHYRQLNKIGRIVSLGCGTGQDVQILGYPNPNYFTGYDISEGMLQKAVQKYPDYHFTKQDCSVNIDVKCDILVSIFGTPNYIGAEKLLEHYENMEASHAFFIFYAEHYNDGVIENYHKYTRDELRNYFGREPVPLEKGSNYYVVSW